MSHSAKSGNQTRMRRHHARRDATYAAGASMVAFTQASPPWRLACEYVTGKGRYVGQRLHTRVDS
eukprot:2747732-Prymnesium_polylepis.1